MPGKKVSELPEKTSFDDSDLVIVFDPSDSKVKRSTIKQLRMSSPPTGKCRITNLYVDPSAKKLVVEYDDSLI